MAGGPATVRATTNCNARGTTLSAVDAILPPYKPVEIAVDLPPPISVNRIWRHGKGRVYRSAEYKKWIILADQQVLAGKFLRGHHTIDGPFEAHILLSSERGRIDCDNSAKILLDWAQSRSLISNDKFARRVTIEWVTASKAPVGCRLIIRELVG